jgi:chemotaxis protein CheD
MAEEETRHEVFLRPGELWFGGGDIRVRTLLGSCVAVTLWHPQARIGGMCHYMTPSRPAGTTVQELSGRYADEALLILLDGVDAHGTRPEEYQVKMFGGGSQFAVPAGSPVDVAAWNVEAGLQLLEAHGLRLSAMHLGGTGHRQVILDIDRGDVWMRHVDTTEELVLR